MGGKSDDENATKIGIWTIWAIGVGSALGGDFFGWQFVLWGGAYLFIHFPTHSFIYSLIYRVWFGIFRSSLFGRILLVVCQRNN